MKPLKLKLEGFIGILKGLGKEVLELDLTNIPTDKKLIALVGPNGRAKTTIIDNLQPYRVMPSKSTTLGPGGFSYWDQFSGLTAAKELEWEHAGRRFLTRFAFKTKSRKADYYLYEWNAAIGDWTPCVTPEGTVSDSKADTYDKCVESILSTPERFFTAQFAAQGRKALSKYGATEVKSLLASMLNLNSFTQLGAKAAAVAKLLRFQFDALQDQLAQSRGADAGIAQAMQEIVQHDLTASTLQNQILLSEEACASARAALATIEAKRASQASVIEEEKFLKEQIASTRATAAEAKQRTLLQQQAEVSRTDVELKRLTAALKSTRAKQTANEQEVQRLEAIASQAAVIEEAATTLPTLYQKLQSLDVILTTNQEKLKALRPVRESYQKLLAELERIKEAGEGKKLMLAQLTETASLIDQVPCKSMPIQTNCQLLAKANAASEKLPLDVKEFEATREKYRTTRQQAEALRIELQACDICEDEISKVTVQRRQIQNQIESLQPVAARKEMLGAAKVQIPQLLEARASYAMEIERDTKAWSALNNDMAKIAAEHAEVIKEMDAASQQAVAGLSDRLDKLAKPISDSEVEVIKRRVADAVTLVTKAKAKAQAHIDTKSGILAKIEVLNNLKEKTKEIQKQATRLQDEIAKWKLIEKGMGNDGLVALSIDDAGPEISRLCNELLAQDDEQRFTVRLDTQRELGTGNMKETFEIMVFDNRGGKECPIGWTSGGEQVWVNECLTRAIALHTSASSGMGYQTLFTDETDGAFDPKRKRQFMKMKRKVLEQGGYEREYFISQTPELWDLADHIIHMDSLI